LSTRIGVAKNTTRESIIASDACGDIHCGSGVGRIKGRITSLWLTSLIKAVCLTLLPNAIKAACTIEAVVANSLTVNSKETHCQKEEYLYRHGEKIKL